MKVDEILIWSSFFGSLIRVNHYSKLKNKNSSYSHLILIKYWAMATDSLLPVMVIVRSTFSLLFLSSQLDILIKAPLICLQTQQRKQIIIFNREFFEVTYWKSFWRIFIMTTAADQTSKVGRIEKIYVTVISHKINKRQKTSEGCNYGYLTYLSDIL